MVGLPLIHWLLKLTYCFHLNINTYPVARLTCFLRGGGLDFFRQGVPLCRVSYSRIKKRWGGGRSMDVFWVSKKFYGEGGGAFPVNAPLYLSIWMDGFFIPVVLERRLRTKSSWLRTCWTKWTTSSSPVEWRSRSWKSTTKWRSVGPCSCPFRGEVQHQHQFLKQNKTIVTAVLILWHEDWMWSSW